MFRSFTLLILIIFVLGCQHQNIINSEPDYSLEKPTSKNVSSTDELMLAAQVVSQGGQLDQIEIVVFRSVSGLPPSLTWSAITDLNGFATVRIDPVIAGYYVISATDLKTGKILDIWHSIPLQKAEMDTIFLPVGGVAYHKEDAFGHLLNTPEEIQINEVTYRLSADVYYNWEPAIFGNVINRGLIALVRLSFNGSTSFPDEIKMVTVWVIHDNSIWESGLSYTGPGEYESSKIARNGPLGWEPGSPIVVIVKIIDNQGKAFYLKASSERLRDLTIHVAS
jgi:hypothetical protein